MENLTSLKCTFREGTLAFQQESLPLDAATLLEMLERGLRSTCFLVDQSEAKRLESHFLDSKTLPLKARNKHSGKPLADYLLLPEALRERRMIVLVRGFKKPGQLERSIRTALQKLVKPIRFVPVLAVDDNLFDEFRTRTTSAGQKGGKAAGGADGQAQETSRAEYGQMVLETLKQQVGDSPMLGAVERAYVGTSATAETIRYLICIAAGSTAPVLILGDTGTGKEVIAQQIHKQSTRREKKFVAVNCSAISPELLESELFGHRRGSFTGAVADHVGLWRSAAGGTIFLDEIGDLDLRHQAKLLRVLEDGTFKPIGENEPVKSDARVVAATNRSLTDMIRAGRFREDLYCRLGGLLIRTSPLREHPEDITALAEFFWRKLAGKRDAILPAAVAKELERQSWTGNTREIRMVMQQLHSLVGNSRPDPEKLRLALYLNGQDAAAFGPARTPSDDGFVQQAEFLRHLKKAADIIQTAKAFAANLPANNRAAAGPAPSPRENLEDQVRRLEELARSSLLFHSRKAYEAVLDLKDKLRHFLGLRTGTAAADYRRKTLNREFERCIAALLDEVGAIVGS